MKKHAWIAAAALAMMTSCAGGKSEASGAEDVPEGWTLVWEDDFDTPETDTAVWSRIDRGTADWNNYMSKLDTLYSWRDGNLVLRGIANFEGSGDSVPYLTGGVWTNGRKNFSRGRVEVRAKLQGARGAWPAIWMLPDGAHRPDGTSRPGWPDGGEIDIMERLNSDSIAYQTIHSKYTLTHGIKDNPRSGYTAPIDPDGYNDYAVEMYADSLRLLINDVVTFTYPRIETDLDGQFPFDAPFYLLIDMQLGGGWVGEVDPADVPVEMLIDRVRFYQPTK